MVLAKFKNYLLALLLIGISIFAIIDLVSVRNAVIFLLGFGLASALIWGKIGFASSWRMFILKQQTAAMFNQIIMIMLTSLFTLPLLMNIDNTTGNIAPVGLSLILGSFIFGIGMQLGDGCGSGTLVASGSGSAHSLVTLVFFIIGSVLGSMHLHWWLITNPIDPISLIQYFSLNQVLFIQFILLSIFAIVIFAINQHKKQPLTFPSKRNLIGALMIAVLVAITLFITGRMWGITFGYTLWGAKMAQALSFDMASYPFWQWSFPAYALSNSVLSDTTSVLNFGMILAAICTTLISSKKIILHLKQKQVIAAMIGGLLMGYGARLSFGCNIGAYFSGIVSGSLHAWIWLIFAFLGSIYGVKLRPRFSMS